MSKKDDIKLKTTLEQRQQESSKIMKKYPDRVPIIVESKTDGLNIDKNKFLVPRDLTMGQFIFTIRKRVQLAPEKALYLFVNDKIPGTSSLISQIYDQDHDEDGYLYCQIAEESTFG